MPHKVVVLHHLLHGVSERDSDGQGQALRNSNNDDGDCVQEELDWAVVVDFLDREALLLHTPPDGHDNERTDCYCKAHLSDGTCYEACTRAEPRCNLGEHKPNSRQLELIQVAPAAPYKMIRGSPQGRQGLHFVTWYCMLGTGSLCLTIA